ncbi:DUF6188 family protein [Actinosynnema sp. NPDC023794]
MDEPLPGQGVAWTAHPSRQADTFIAVAPASCGEQATAIEASRSAPLADGSRLVVDSSREYEPWMLSGPAELPVVSTPGGASALWHASATHAIVW